MELVKNLNEDEARSGNLQSRKCCKTTPKGLDTIDNEDGPTTYQVYCKKCNTKTAPYETLAEAGFAWENKLLL